MVDLITSFEYISYSEILLLAGSAALFLILLTEIFDVNNWIRKIFGDCETDFEYGYEEYNGPLVWKQKYAEACGSLQSPINIPCKNAMVMPCAPLIWSPEYACIPSCMFMINDGHSALLRFSFPGRRPTLSGGSLPDQYELYTIRFRWGPCDDEGSEHTIDYTRYAMEMQAVHVRTGMDMEECGIEDVGKDNVVFVSYLFQITSVDNPYLEPIVSKLKYIKHPQTKVRIDSIPLSWLIQTFSGEYYTYQGSLTFPPCTEGVKWIVQPEPLAISSKQVKKFRKLLTCNGRMLANTRPVQNLNNRDIFYHTNVAFSCH